jgi:hypothetical protein
VPFYAALVTDNAGGIGRVNEGGLAYHMGQVVGDGIAVIQGTVEVAVGGAGEVGGTALIGTGVGAPAGVAIDIASTAAIVHGGATGLTGAAHLGKAIVTAFSANAPETLRLLRRSRWTNKMQTRMGDRTSALSAAKMCKKFKTKKATRRLIINCNVITIPCCHREATASRRRIGSSVEHVTGISTRRRTLRAETLHMSSDEETLVTEVIFPIEKDAEGYPKSRDFEALLCEPLDAECSICTVKSVPFYLRSVAFGDTISAEEDLDGNLRFKGVVKRGGYSVYRVLLHAPSRKEDLIARLLESGALVEQDKNLIAFAVPPTTNADALIDYILA